MSLLQWRRFSFFDKEIIKSDDFEETFQGINWSCHCNGFGNIIIGDTSGNIYMMNKQLAVTTFRAYEVRVSLLHYLKQTNLFVSVGHDQEETDPIIKVWYVEKMDKNGIPLLSLVTKAVTAISSKATSISVHENLNLMAIGFESGCVVLFTGDVLKESRHSKQRVLYDSHHRVTGLFFQPQVKNLILFIVTEGEVIRVSILPKDKDQQLSLANHGATLNCSLLSDGSHNFQLVVARQDAIYFYETDGRGPCLLFEGSKTQLHWHRNYMIVVSKEDATIKSDTGLEKNIITVYDVENKFIAYLGPISKKFAVVSEWGSLYVLTADKKIHQLIEKDTQSKLNILFKKNMYMLAISLAQQMQYDKDAISDIHKQFADYLYTKGDYDAATVQYIRTIGKLEPSYVIRKHLDTARIYNLTSYLEALHKQQRASEDHTTLLLNCYAKLKDEQKLNEFITREHLDFDVETTIKVCRSSGFYKQALQLALKYKKHDYHLKILIEDVKEYEVALKYITKLAPFEVTPFIKKYGKVLMDHLPDATTDFLIKLCIENDFDDMDIYYDELISIFIDNWWKLMEFLEHLTNKQCLTEDESKKSKIYTSLLEVYLRDLQKTELASEVKLKKEKIIELLKNKEASYDTNVAFILCQSHNFEEGTLYLQEKNKLYDQMLSFHMEKKEYSKILDLCKTYGNIDSNLWISALSYFAHQSNDCMSQINTIIEYIELNHSFSPLFVIQTLAQSPSITLGVVKDYIIRFLQKESDEISENEKIVEQLKADTEELERKILENETEPKEFQNQRCNICNHSLDLPTVHFLCLHSFHQHCYDSYSENDSECPICSADYKKIVQLTSVTELTKEFHDQFDLKMRDSDDAFSVVAEYFGKNLFQNQKDSKLR